MPSNNSRILVIDDEKQIRRVLTTALAGCGYDIAEAASGHDGLTQTAIFHPDLIILDLGLPDLDGTEVVRLLREWTPVPIIILSVREQEGDKIEALDGGADDYVTKPFGMSELLARIRASLRHAATAEDEPVVTVGELTVDLPGRMVTVGGQKLRLTVTEYEILKYLATHAGKIVTHAQLLRAVRGPNHQEETHYLRVYIAQLRHKIEADPNRPRYILTEPGVGYRLVTD